MIDSNMDQIIITRENGTSVTYSGWYSILDLPREEIQQLLKLKPENMSDKAKEFLMDIKGQVTALRK